MESPGKAGGLPNRNDFRHVVVIQIRDHRSRCTDEISPGRIEGVTPEQSAVWREASHNTVIAQLCDTEKIITLKSAR